MDLNEVKDASLSIRRQYRMLEEQLHGKPWTTEEDALAFLTDAGLVGRLTMAKEGRWPSGDEAMLRGMCLVAGRPCRAQWGGFRCGRRGFPADACRTTAG